MAPEQLVARVLCKPMYFCTKGSNTWKLIGFKKVFLGFEGRGG